MTQAALQTCENCGDVIGRLEQPGSWQGSRVCSLCHAKLTRAATIVPIASAASVTNAPVPTVPVSPPPLPPLPPPRFPDGIDLDLLRDITGQTEVRTVAHARVLLDMAQGNYSHVKSAVFGARIKSAILRLRYAETRIGITPVVDAVMLASAPTLLTAIFLIFVFRPSFAVLVVILGAVYGVGIVLFLGLFMDGQLENDDNRLETRRNQNHQQAAILSDRIALLKTANEELRRTSALHHGVVAASRSAVNTLLHVNVNALDGPGFEQFLASVFRARGYTVTHVGRTGDQGADLIVAAGKMKVVVQAKCYSGSVGNSAVQEAHAGKGFHHCHRCMVVTNSHFTPSAVALAKELGCGLIDGGALPLLIRGQIPI